jgi:hypothetical protein
MTFIWKANPPRCKDCCGREKDPEEGAALKEKMRKVSLQMKPKPRVNGKPLHTALYMSAFGYGDTDFVPSEMSGQRAVDVHHLICRGSGGTKREDRIENLVALTREEHMEYGDKTQHMAMLYALHMDFMEKSGVKFDREWILGQIEKYSEI